MDFSQRRLFVRQELQSLLTEYEVNAVVRERHFRDVCHMPLGSYFAAYADGTRLLNHVGVQVNGGDGPTGTQRGRDRAADDACSAGDVQDLIIRLNRRPVADAAERASRLG